MNKADLIAQLNVLRNTFFLGWAACYVLNQPESHSYLQGSDMGFEQWIPELEKNNDRSIYLMELQKYLARALMKEPFELIKEYTKKTNQVDLFKSQPWYLFAWLIRNAMSHNMHFNFEKQHRKFLPVTWNGKTIDTSMEGQILSIDFMPPQDIVMLIDMMIDFVKKYLS